MRYLMSKLCFHWIATLSWNKIKVYVWQNQSELHRLKYASPLSRAPTYFKQCNPLACRVTSQWTTECRIKQDTSHEGECRDTISVIFYITGIYITWVVKSNISFKLIGFITNRFKFSSLWQRNLKRGHCTRRHGIGRAESSGGLPE
jgi:hypothetical protein